MLPTKFQFIWSSGFRGEHFQKSTNQKQELPVVAMFVNELCFSRFLTTDRYLGILRYLFLCILFVSIKSKLLKSQNNRRQKIVKEWVLVYERGRENVKE